METLVGRVVKNAEIRTTKNDKQVVNFSIAVNDSYKAKNDSEAKKVVRYFNCAYWINTTIAEHLIKGTLVELNGRINLDTWENMECKTIAALAMHVNNIKLHGKSTGKKEADTNESNTATAAGETGDDLPF